MKILVTGATGYIGGRLVPKLLEKGYFVRCLARRPENLQGRFWNVGGNAVETVAADLLDAASLEQACEGIDIAYYLVHSMSAGEHGFEERDRKAAHFFSQAAKKAGIRRIIYLGGLGEEHASLSHHLASRHEVGNILRESGVSVTEFRAAIIVGSGSVSFEMIRCLTERLPVMVCPKWVVSVCQPISIRDVLKYLVDAVSENASEGKILDIGGPDKLTYRDMMLGYAKVRGLKRSLIRVPVLTPRLSSYWVDFITPIPAALGRPLIEGLKNDVVCRNEEALKIFPFEPLGYEEAVRLALDRTAQGDVETAWWGTESIFSKNLLSPMVQVHEGFILERRSIEIPASADKVFQVVSSLGGNRGWLYADWAWKIRGWLDRLMGGVGMRRGRRDEHAVRIGDAIDFWRVEAVNPGSLLRLRAEMKVPGKAWLQFQIQAQEHSSKTLLIQTAFFEPKGLGGLLYWYMLYPLHQLIFTGLCRQIREQSLL
jgi:uncharacterized protein YbjT (DUF2867 family)